MLSPGHSDSTTCSSHLLKQISCHEVFFPQCHRASMWPCQPDLVYYSLITNHKEVLFIRTKGQKVLLGYFFKTINTLIGFAFWGKRVSGMVMEEITKCKHSTTMPASAVRNIRKSTQYVAPLCKNT